jgi:hypothetical protein
MQHIDSSMSGVLVWVFDGIFYTIEMCQYPPLTVNVASSLWVKLGHDSAQS